MIDYEDQAMAFGVVAVPYFSEVGPPPKIPYFELIAFVVVLQHYIFFSIPLRPTVGLYSVFL